jgi:alkylated DNA repair protein alkB family protein 1
MLLDKLLHRDLSEPQHLTNLHAHYHMSYPRSSFFHQSALNLSHEPRDRTVHTTALSNRTALEKKLRWVTLGGQYDWSAKQYPPEQPPDCPPDIGRLVSGLFPAITPQAAIVNVYSPGDVLSLHRDVSENCDRPLVSISIGCDALFMVALGEHVLPIRLRSGDAVLMSGSARYAWHGVPRILPNTCPEHLAKWPATGRTSDEYEHWRGWLCGKRINLNVRQMWD